MKLTAVTYFYPRNVAVVTSDRVRIEKVVFPPRVFFELEAMLRAYPATST